MTPKTLYHQKIAANDLRPDANQAAVIDKLENIFQALIESDKQRRRWLNPWRKKTVVKGLYLWGSVGIGKTFLMDCFYEALPLKKMRTHFHAFMREVHQALTSIQGEKNPLCLIAKKIVSRSQVICFDEFLVSNIADAMILSELFHALFTEGITLITSANSPPDLLYKDGLQRERFLPAILLLKSHTEIVHLHTHTDYRKRHIQQAGVYYCPADALASKNMDNCFVHFTSGAASTRDPVTICHREIPIVKRAGSVIWFEFETLCGRPRSQLDYLEMVKHYHTILISHLRHIEPSEKALITSLVYLIDILYDAHCRLIVSADVPVDGIYTKGDALEAFQRTYSRLIEMQSENYVYPGSMNHDLTLL